MTNSLQSRSIQDTLASATLALQKASNLKFHHPQLEARWLLEHVLNKSFTWIVANQQKICSQTESVHYQKLIDRRVKGEPIAYILGHQDFWTLNLKVSQHTLIPRQDTEILVESVLALSLPENASVLDLGTGTGAIALALAKERHRWKICGVDRINAAVELAKENAVINRLDVSFIQSHWFEAVKGEKFDLIVSNPPYVEQNNPCLREGDVQYEPVSALCSGEDGLDDIRHIISHAYDYLNDLGFIAFEHGNTQAEAIQTLMRDKGFINIQSNKDYNQQDRVTIAQKTA